MSTITAIPYIAQSSEASPENFNRNFRALWDNIVSVNTQITTGVNASGFSISVPSSTSDYLYFHDSLQQKSSYVIGSHVGGTADGLNIFDESGNTMIASFSKQSIRFFQNVVGPVFDVGGAFADTLNAGTYGTGADSRESRIQAAILAASNQGISRVYVPANMYPYSASSVSFVYTVQMVREGGEWSSYDIRAYGANSLGVLSSVSAAQEAMNAASSAGSAQVLFPTGIYNLASNLSIPANIGIILHSGVSFVGIGKNLVSDKAAANSILDLRQGAIKVMGNVGLSSLVGLGFGALQSYVPNSLSTNFGNIGIGHLALQYDTTGDSNVAVGHYSLASNLTGSQNVAVGAQALLSNTGSKNVAVGTAVLVHNTTGASNTGLGNEALETNLTGARNTAVGDSAMVNNSTGTDNVAAGYFALQGNSTGDANVAVGNVALEFNTTGARNIGVGSQANFSNQTSNENVAVGFQALALNRGEKNTAVGGSSLVNNSTGTGNVAVGWDALNSNTTGYNNTAIGYQTLEKNNQGSTNVAVGWQSLASNTTGYSNTAVGSNPMINNTTGYNNTAMGVDALFDNTTGFSNTAIGSNALGFGAPGGNQNTAVGWRASFWGGNGVGNVAVGVTALNENFGTFNTALGTGALSSNSTGVSNVVIGVNAMLSNRTGNRNVVIGPFAAQYETGSDKFYVDNQDRTNQAGDRATALLYGTFAAAAANQALTINSNLTINGATIAQFGAKAGSFQQAAIGTADGAGSFQLLIGNTLNTSIDLTALEQGVNWRTIRLNPTAGEVESASSGIYTRVKGHLSITSRLVSLRTLAASAVTASAANSAMTANEIVFTIGGASGASLLIHSGGTVYGFTSSFSAKAT